MTVIRMPASLRGVEAPGASIWGSRRVGLMRFGLFVPQGWRHDLVGIDPSKQWEAMLGVARLAEDLGFESIWVYDHFHTVPVPSEEATHEAWTLMAAFGAATSRVRLGPMCTRMGDRNPMYLQEGGIPLWIAGGGEKKTLRLAAQYAAYTNFDGTLEGFRRKSEVLAGHCK